MPNKTHTDIELPIARHLIHHILSEGFEIALHDGEEIAVPRTRNFGALNQGLASTDHDNLIIYLSGAPKRIGTITLIWGNGCDILHDHTDRPEFERLTRPTMDYAESLERKWDRIANG